MRLLCIRYLSCLVYNVEYFNSCDSQHCRIHSVSAKMPPKKRTKPAMAKPIDTPFVANAVKNECLAKMRNAFSKTDPPVLHIDDAEPDVKRERSSDHTNGIREGPGMQAANEYNTEEEKIVIKKEIKEEYEPQFEEENKTPIQLKVDAVVVKEEIDYEVIMNEDEDPASRKRRLAKERQKRWRANQSQKLREKIPALVAVSHRKRSSKTDPPVLHVDDTEPGAKKDATNCVREGLRRQSANNENNTEEVNIVMMEEIKVEYEPQSEEENKMPIQLKLDAVVIKKEINYEVIMNKDEDPVSRKRRLANERQKRWRAKQSQKSREKIRALDAASHRKRSSKTDPPVLHVDDAEPDAKKERSSDRTNCVREGLRRQAANDENNTEEEKIVIKKEIKEEYEHQYEEENNMPIQLNVDNVIIKKGIDYEVIMNEDEDPASRKRRLANERQKRWRANQSQKSHEKIRNLDAASHRERINQMTPEQLAAHRLAHNASQRQYIERMTPEQLAAYHVARRASQQRYMDRLKSSRR